MRIPALLILCASASASMADTVIAARNLRPGAVLQASDILAVRGEVSGSFSQAAQVIGKEAKVALYAGRAIMTDDLSRPASVERNQLIELIYQSNSMTIHVEGRALGRGAIGDRIRVMNLTSKTNLFGTIQADGTIRVSK